jgi:hypothetical protein
VASNTQDALAALRKRTLVQDDVSDPGGRIYRDSKGQIYHSVTRILQATQSEAAKKALERWQERLGPQLATQERDTAASRGTLVHSQAEYFCKTTMQLARNTANRRNALKWDNQGLARIPHPITKWALERVYPNLPRAGWSASGYSNGLSEWIRENCTEIFASEFSTYHCAGFAGTADALVSLEGHGKKIFVCDWKTSAKRKTLEDENGNERLPDSHNYIHQCGAYSLGLRYLCPSIEVAGAAIVLARRVGPPNVHIMHKDELVQAEDAFLERVATYFENLHTAIHTA